MYAEQLIILAVKGWIYPAFRDRLAVFGERFLAHLGRDSLYELI
jgi:hypothetical protein